MSEWLSQPLSPNSVPNSVRPSRDNGQFVKRSPSRKVTNPPVLFRINLRMIHIALTAVHCAWNAAFFLGIGVKLPVSDSSRNRMDSSGTSWCAVSRRPWMRCAKLSCISVCSPFHTPANQFQPTFCIHTFAWRPSPNSMSGLNFHGRLNMNLATFICRDVMSREIDNPLRFIVV
jgi:hypothetical protein